MSSATGTFSLHFTQYPAPATPTCVQDMKRCMDRQYCYRQLEPAPWALLCVLLLIGASNVAQLSTSMQELDVLSH